MAIVNVFNEGLNLRNDPTLVNPSQALQLVNVNKDGAKLESIKSTQLTETETGRHIYNFKDKWIGSDNDRDYAEFGNRLYYTENDNRPNAVPTGLMRYEEPDEDGNEVDDIRMGLPVPNTELGVVPYLPFNVSRTLTIPTNAVRPFRNVPMVLLFERVSFTEETAGGVNLNPFDLSRTDAGIYSVDEETRRINEINRALDTINNTSEREETRSFKINDVDNNEILIFTTRANITDNDLFLKFNLSYPVDFFTNINEGIAVEDQVQGYRMSAYISEEIAGSNRITKLGLNLFRPIPFSFPEPTPVPTLVGTQEYIVIPAQFNNSIFELSSDNLSYELSFELTRDRQTVVERLPIPIELRSRTFTYALTVYDDVTGFESPPVFSESIITDRYTSMTIDFNQGNLDAQGLAGKQARIYRIGDFYRDFTLVHESTIVSILDNPIRLNTTTFFDYRIFDSTNVEVGRILDTVNERRAPDDFKFPTVFNGILFGAVDNTLIWSSIGRFQSFPIQNSIAYEKDLTGLLAIPQGVLVFTLTDTYLISLNNSQFPTNILISRTQGNKTHKSGKLVRNSPLWISYEGICTFANGYVQVLSKNLLGNTNIDVERCENFDEEYYIFMRDGRFLVADLRFGLKFYHLIPAIKGIALHNYANGLYTSVDQIGGGHRLARYFTGTDNETLVYQSPSFTEGDHSEIKTYHNIYVRSNGTFNVRVYINDNEVCNRDIEGNDIFDLKLSEPLQLGSALHVIIIGKGIVTAYGFRAGGRAI